MSKSGKIKVVVLGTRGFPNVQGGVESHCYNLYPRLRKRNCSVIVFSKQPYTGDKIINCEGVRLVPLKCSKRKHTETFGHTLRGVLLARRIHPDIVHFHAIGPSLFVPIARLLGMKVVVTHHGADYKRGKWGWLARSVLKIGERLGCKYANQIVAVSAGIKTHIKKEFNRNANFIPNGIEFIHRSEESTYIESLGLKANKYILAVARFVPEKGLDDLISAYSNIDTDWKLVIAGDADHETSYSRNLKSEIEKNDDIIMTGFIQGDDLVQMYSHAGLFVLPSYHEGLPIVLLEALSYGLSVLVSDIEPNKEIGLDAERYFPVGNIENLTGKLNEMINKGNLSESEQINQINNMDQKYNWDNIADEVLRVYKEIMTFTPKTDPFKM